MAKIIQLIVASDLLDQIRELGNLTIAYVVSNFLVWKKYCRRER